MEKISISRVVILSGVIVFLFCANADAAAKTSIKQKRKDKVEVIKRKNGQWQLLVNSICDTAYESWVDTDQRRKVYYMFSKEWRK